MISDPLSDLVSGVVSELKDPRVPDFASVVRLYTAMDGPLSADLDVLLPPDLGDL